MAGFGSVTQADWGGGIFRGRNAPSGSVYDAVNTLVNDERELFKRGGGAYSSLSGSNIGTGTLTGIASVFFPEDVPVRSVVVWRAAADQVFSRGGVTDQLIADAAYIPPALARGAAVGAFFVLPVTRSSTGAPLLVRTGGVQANTLLLALPVGVAGDPAFAAVATVGSPPRVLVAFKNRMYFSDPVVSPSVPSGFTTSNFHEVPLTSNLIGLDSILNTALMFGTGGVWAVENMDLDPVDDVGNVQQSVRQISKDVVLWADSGLAGWGNELLVPARDDVYLMGLSGPPVAISAAIRPLYRSYVKAGYRPGIAAVFRSHYLLPIVDSSNALVDVLVCRLDLADRDGMRPAWTRWSGHGACVAYAVLPGVGAQSPALVGVAGQRILDLTASFDSTNTATEADGTTHPFTVDTQDYATGNGMRDAYVDRIRVEYEMAGSSPIVAVGWADGAEGASFTTLTAVRGGGASDGTDYSAWPVRKSRDRIRFRFASTSAVTKLILRRLEILVRAGGRQ